MRNATNGVWLQPDGGRVLAAGFRQSGPSEVEAWLADVADPGSAIFALRVENSWAWAGTDHPHFVVVGSHVHAVAADGWLGDGTPSRNLWLLTYELKTP